MRAPIIMDISGLALTIKDWKPIYHVGTGVTYMHYYSAYFPFRDTDQFLNLDIVYIQNLLLNENDNLARIPQMIPRVLVRQIQ
jgi:hypothetical protein